MIFTNFIAAIAEVLNLAITLYMYIVIARALMSWFNPNPYNQIVQFINRITDPPLLWIRKNLPVVVGGMDLSPIILIFALMFLNRFLMMTLRQIASF